MSFRITSNSVDSFGPILIFVVLSACVVGCREEPVRVATTKPAIAVNVLTLKRVEKTLQTATYFGLLEPSRQRVLGFSVPGEIKMVTNRGQSVSENSLLAELDSSELSRQKQLLESQITTATSQQQLLQIRQQIEDLNRQIATRRLVAPFNCVVDEVFVFEKSLIRAQSPALRIIDTQNPRIKINLPKRVAEFIQPELDVYFVVDGETLVGNLTQKSETEKAGSQFCWFNIQSELENVELNFGQTVESKFSFETDNAGYWVPLESLDRSGQGVWSVMLVNSANTVRRKLVTIVQLTDKAALIDGNDLDDALLIVNGIHRIVPGQSVETRLIESDEVFENENPDE